MKLFSSIFKKLLYFLKRKLFMFFRKWNPALFSPSSKNKKKSPRKHFFIFQEMKLFSSIFKILLYFLKRKLFLYFRKWNPALFSPSSKNKKNSPRENYLNTQILKNFLYFRKRKPRKKFLYFLLKRKLFLYFKKRNFLIFQETKTFKNFLYFRNQLFDLKK